MRIGGAVGISVCGTACLLYKWAFALFSATCHLVSVHAYISCLLCRLRSFGALFFGVTRTKMWRYVFSSLA